MGLCDVGLGYMVVTASLDPGEYLQGLQRSSSISPAALRKHAIDLHLGRYELALGHLVSAGEE